MESNKLAPTSTPAPVFVGVKRYFLLPIALLVAYLGYLAFAEPLLFSVEFDKAMIVPACLTAFVFMGLLVWASKENDKDKVWAELLDSRLKKADRPRRDATQLVDLLPENSDELAVAFDSQMVSKFESTDPSGKQLNRRLTNIVLQLAKFGTIIVLTDTMKLLMLWGIGKATESQLEVTFSFLIAGIIILIPARLIRLFNRNKQLLLSTGYKRLDTASSKHRRYAFFKYHRQVLIDNGFKELFDACYDSNTCTLFASSNRDVIVEIALSGYGRFYYGARTATADGTLFETRSGGLIELTPSDPDAIQICICEQEPIETILQKHAILLANRLLESKSQLVTLNDSVVDQLFLANRFRSTL